MHTELSSERLPRERLGAQIVLPPTSAEWTALCERRRLDGVGLIAPKAIFGWFNWLENYDLIPDLPWGCSPSTTSGSVLRYEIGVRYLQVHFEDVVCENATEDLGYLPRHNHR
jgi:hypothetical protein